MDRVNGDARLWIAVGVGVVLMLVGLSPTTRAHAETTVTPTPYHEGIPAAETTPHPMVPSLYPLPSAEDRASADAMAAGGAAMVEMAERMDEAAILLLRANDSQLVALGQHWVLDAQALRQQAAWMILSATAADMVHDPARAHETNTWNLKGNGLAMSDEGQAMSEHGQEMMDQVKQLQEADALSPEQADQLLAASQQIVASGDALQRDGQRMQDAADAMLAAIGG